MRKGNKFQPNAERQSKTAGATSLAELGRDLEALRAAGLVHDTGERRDGETVWAVVERPRLDAFFSLAKLSVPERALLDAALVLETVRVATSYGGVRQPWFFFRTTMPTTAVEVAPGFYCASAEECNSGAMPTHFVHWFLVMPFVRDSKRPRSLPPDARVSLLGSERRIWDGHVKAGAHGRPVMRFHEVKL